MSLEGQQLGEFEILERLGQGGMGAVYKARQRSLKRLVALKTLQLSIAEDAEYIARFQQEAVAAAGLNHPNLVQVHSAGENDGLHWFAMEYVEGESAKARLNRKGRLDPLEAIAITLHVATALEYGWRKAALIHRDIKPDNIFLSSDGEVKLGDLGLAKSAGQTTGLTVTGHSMGTPHYISPEQVQDMKVVDFRADIYSLGCTLYHFLSGRAPFDGTSAVAIMVKHINEPVPILQEAWPECPEVLNEVVGKMMQKDPARRQQDYAELIRDLRQAYDVVSNSDAPAMVAETPEDVSQANAAVSTKPSGSIPPQKPTPAKSKVPIYAGIVVVMGVVAAAAFFLFKPKSPDQTGGASTAISVATATKDSPFVNSLGMKFVPVPVVGGPTGGQRVLFSVWDTRVQDYEQFVKDTKRDWPKVDFEQSPTHPAVMVSWDDAREFCGWLTEREHKSRNLSINEEYRLPTDHEWSCAAEIGDREDPSKMPAENNAKLTDVYPWGTQWPPPNNSGNYASEELRPFYDSDTSHFFRTTIISGYHDGYAFTSPVGTYAADRFGLYDLGGNVWQWCEDWFDQTQTVRVMRGGSWNHGYGNALLSSRREPHEPQTRGTFAGFRCVIASITAPGIGASSATKDSPFVNTLGMKFVPVPGTKVLFSIWDTRVQDYKAYAAARKVDDSWTKQEKNGVPVSRDSDDPVVGVSWDDAESFNQWLTEKEIGAGKIPQGSKYRLPTDEEWSIAVGLPPEQGATPKERRGKNNLDYPWGRGFPPKAKVGNYADTAFHQKFPTEKDWIDDYTDGYATTSPVGSFPANAYGLYDMGGNVWQWCQDWFDKDQKDRGLRGASWEDNNNNDHLDLLSSARHHHEPGIRDRYYGYGFRCVLELPAKAEAIAPPPDKATKDSPFVNSLGMKFVPVPGTEVLFSIWDTRVQDYEVFATDTKRSWPKPDFDQGATHPAVNVSWNDTEAFCKWLTNRGHNEGTLPPDKMYRLPTDHEWSCAAGIGEKEDAAKPPSEKSGAMKDVYPWGTQWPPPPRSGNYAGEEKKSVLAATKGGTNEWIPNYDDGFVYTSPVGSFGANRFGLYDMGGNVWQWCEDWFDASQIDRVLRGGSWFYNGRNTLLSSYRDRHQPFAQLNYAGFRCVIAPATAATPESATKDSPFANTLGMKFVPVPGTKVLFSIWDTRVQDYKAYAAVNKVDDSWTKENKDAVPISRESDYPVVGVSWEDAKGFNQWLTNKEITEGKLPKGAQYRLPTDEEWSVAVGLPQEEGTTPAEKSQKNNVDLPWGKDYPPRGKVGNYADETFHAKFPLKEDAKDDWNKNRWIEGYADGYATTSPVGSFPANTYGLYDMGGNVRQWCEDWFDASRKDCVLRGSSWNMGVRVGLLSSVRIHDVPTYRNGGIGFRCVLELPPK